MKHKKLRKLCVFILLAFLIINLSGFKKVQASVTNTSGQDIVNYAKTFLGLPYKYGGTTPSGFDCSGYVQYVYGHYGISLPRTAEQQFSQGQAVDKSSLIPGDLVFFDNPIGHVGIYVGDGKFIHSPHTGDVVKISSLSESYYVREYAGARRILSIAYDAIDYLIFDADFYASKYPDLKQAFGNNYDALFAHWEQNGKAEGRAPSELFDPVYYLDSYSDLKQAFGTNYVAAYDHFKTDGIKQGRKSSPVFDISYYRTENPDLYTLTTNLSLLEHFKGNGMNEGRIASADFNIYNYKKRYPDLVAIFGDYNKAYFDHYLIQGITEGRIGN